ncbi:TetR/AcrR family transcriptional regulator [Paenibacillus sp. Y412MC10]|uniref:TetR/AcrR family transcriptional regulator n=1 Tax=Geobacillus sp. (strain Y412MC10) TaxID=481743 RepID=UPI0011AB511E|nr:TetR/AcrR family transcriptional regulator [Paenibacillus sp. Y412MC10]
MNILSEKEVIYIYTKFNSLEQKKQERIINEAMKEFARSGYDRASTNKIIKEADIAKGSLFVYFNNKKELYLFLLDYISEAVSKIYDEVDWTETDILKRIWGIGLVKLKFYKKYPQAFDFLKAASHENAAEVKSEIDKMSKANFEILFKRFYEDMDLTKFRDDIDIEAAISVMNWTITGFAQQQVDRLSSSDEISMDVLEEWQKYLAFLNQCFYKKEENNEKANKGQD